MQDISRGSKSMFGWKHEKVSFKVGFSLQSVKSRDLQPHSSTSSRKLLPKQPNRLPTNSSTVGLGEKEPHSRVVSDFFAESWSW